MSLISLKQHMMKVRVANLFNLATLFKVAPETMRCLLTHWMRKGCIRRCEKVGCAKACQGCSLATAEIYEWVGFVP